MSYLDDVWQWIVAAALALLALWLARSIDGHPRSDIDMGGVKASPRTWFIILAVIAVLMEVLGFALDFTTREAAWRSIGKTDDKRFVFLVSEFSGAGGPDAASQVRDGLSQALGSGVQVLRVPLKTKPPAYGDIERRTEAGTLESGQCLKRINGDVVVWGEYHEASDVATLAYSVKGEPCLQLQCGLLVVGGAPTSVQIAGIATRDARATNVLLNAAVTKVLLPIQPDPHFQRASCLGDRKFLEAYRTKTENLLDGLPRDASPSFVGVIATGLGVYELRLAELTRDERLLDRAIQTLEAARSKAPADASGYGAVYAEALVGKMEFRPQAPERRILAQRVDAIAPPPQTDEAGFDVAHTLAYLRGKAWYWVYLASDADADRQRSSDRFNEALRLNGPLDERLHLNVALALLYLAHADRHPTPVNYAAAASALTAADRTYYQGGAELAAALGPDLTYEFHGLRLEAACRFRGRERLVQLITEAERDVARLPRGSSPDPGYRKSRADAYACLFHETGDERLLVEAIDAQRQLAAEAGPNSEGAAAAAAAIARYRLIAFERLRTQEARSQALQALHSAQALYTRRGDATGAAELKTMFEHEGVG